MDSVDSVRSPQSIAHARLQAFCVREQQPNPIEHIPSIPTFAADLLWISCQAGRTNRIDLILRSGTSVSERSRRSPGKLLWQSVRSTRLRLISVRCGAERCRPHGNDMDFVGEEKRKSSRVLAAPAISRRLKGKFPKSDGFERLKSRSDGPVVRSIKIY